MLSLDAVFVEMRVLDQHVTSVFLVPCCVEDDWPTGVDDVESLDNDSFVDDLAAETREEGKEGDRQVKHEVLIEDVTDDVGVSPVSLPTMVKK